MKKWWALELRPENEVKLNPKKGTSAIELLSILCWPDTAQRAEPLVAFSAEMIGRGEFYAKVAKSSDGMTVPPQLTRPLFDTLGVRGEEVAKRWSPQVNAIFAQGAAEATNDIKERLFEPSGGLRGVAAARSIDEMIRHVHRAIAHGAASAALQLLIVVRMKQSHEIAAAASLARAITVLEAMHFGGNGLGKERALKDHWKQWGPIAPYWAGLMIEGGYPWGQTGLSLSFERLLHGIFDGLDTTPHLKSALQYGSWLRDFSVTYTPPKAQGPLLPPENAVFIKSGLKPKQPALPPLNAEELATAMRHEAYTLKPSDM